MNLNELSAPLYLGFTYLLVFPIGYLLLDFKAFKKFRIMPFSMRFPIYLAFGLLSSTVIYYVVGLMIIDAQVPIIIFSVSLLILLIKKRGDKLTDFDFKSPLKSLFLISFIYLSYIVGYLRWPLPSDALNHGKMTTQIIYNNKVTEWIYPPGFAVTAANLSLSLNLYPGEAIFILGAAITTLIPSILYSLTYINTGSKTFSLLAYCSAFLIHSSNILPFERWVIGYFIAGIYSSLFGFLAVFTFSIFISLKDDSQKNPSKLIYLFPVLLINVCLFIIYSPFFPFTLIYLVYILSVNAKMIVGKFFTLSKYQKALISILLLFLVLILILTISFQNKQILRIFNMIKNPTRHLMVPSSYIGDLRFGLPIFVGALIAVFLILKRSNASISIFYLIIFTPTILSLNASLFQYIRILLPFRAVLMLACLSWVMFPILLDFLLKIRNREGTFISLKLAGRHVGRIKIRSFRYLTEFFAIILIISIFAPTLNSHFSLNILTSPPTNYFLKQSGFTSDFEALEWIDRNIPPEDLILNDFSFSSFYLLSFSYRNVTTFYQSHSKATYDSFQVWRKPEDSNFLRLMIEKYDVKYIFVTSEPRFFDYLYKGPAEYTVKFYTPSEYIDIFDSYPFLTPIFRQGESVIYKISS